MDLVLVLIAKFATLTPLKRLTMKPDVKYFKMYIKSLSRCASLYLTDMIQIFRSYFLSVNNLEHRSTFLSQVKTIIIYIKFKVYRRREIMREFHGPRGGS